MLPSVMFPELLKDHGLAMLPKPGKLTSPNSGGSSTIRITRKLMLNMALSLC